MPDAPTIGGPLTQTAPRARSASMPLIRGHSCVESIEQANHRVLSGSRSTAGVKKALKHTPIGSRIQWLQEQSRQANIKESFDEQKLHEQGRRANVKESFDQAVSDLHRFVYHPDRTPVTGATRTSTAAAPTEMPNSDPRPYKTRFIDDFVEPQPKSASRLTCTEASWRSNRTALAEWQLCEKGDLSPGPPGLLRRVSDSPTSTQNAASQESSEEGWPSQPPPGLAAKLAKEEQPVSDARTSGGPLTQTAPRARSASVPLIREHSGVESIQQANHRVLSGSRPTAGVKNALKHCPMGSRIQWL